MASEFDQLTPETLEVRLLFEYQTAFEELHIPIDHTYFEHGKLVYNVQTGVELATRKEQSEQLNRILEAAFLDARDMCLAEQLIYEPDEERGYLTVNTKLQDFSVPELRDGTAELRDIKGKIRAKHFHDVADKMGSELNGAILQNPSHEPITILNVYANDNGAGRVSQSFSFAFATGIPELRYDIRAFAEELSTGGTRIIKDGVDISEQTRAELTKLVNEDDAFAQFDEYVRGGPKPHDYLFSDIDGLPKDEKKQFYTEWAKMLGDIETLMVDAANPDTQISELVEKLKTDISRNPSAVGQRAKWALETGMVEIVKTKVRMQYATELETNGKELVNIMLGFQPKTATAVVTESGAIVISLQDPEDYKLAEKGKLANALPIGAAFFSKATLIRSISGSLEVLGPRVQKNDGSIEHEDCHRINFVTIPGLHIQQVSVFANSHNNEPDPLQGRITNTLSTGYVNFQDEIIAYSVMAKVNPNAAYFEQELTKEGGLYDNLDIFSDL